MENHESGHSKLALDFTVRTTDAISCYVHICTCVHVYMCRAVIDVEAAALGTEIVARSDAR